MYLTALFAPFLGSALAGLMGRWIGARGSGIVTITGLFTRMTFSYFIFYEVLILGSPVVISLGSWFSAHSVSVDWLLSFDAQTASMMVTVSTVSFCVHFYSQGYMQADPHQPRFLSYQSLFTGSMQQQVRANDLVTLLVGWEMIGVCSYQQIGFWFHRQSRTKAAQKAMQVNRVSDTILLIGLFFCWRYQGSTDTTQIRAVRRSAEYSDLICLFLAGGAQGKSAQVGLHVWLADAMEGFLSFVQLFTNIYQFLVLFCWGARFIWLIMEKFLFAFAKGMPIQLFCFAKELNCFRNFSRNCKFSNSIGENGFNKFEIGLIVGQMLRDGSQQNNRFEKNPNSKRNRRLAMCIRRNVLYYQNWLHSDQLKNYFTTAPPYPYPKNSPTQYSVNSRRLPVFTNIYKYWYKKKKGVRIKKSPYSSLLEKAFY